MEQYIGLDVSLKETHLCVVDGAGGVLARGRTAKHPWSSGASAVQTRYTYSLPGSRSMSGG
jgi:hypothetical protein